MPRAHVAQFELTSLSEDPVRVTASSAPVVERDDLRERPSAAIAMLRSDTPYLGLLN
jgi:hypothetical protein